MNKEDLVILEEIVDKTKEIEALYETLSDDAQIYLIEQGSPHLDLLEFKGMLIGIIGLIK
jgi:hypothetical protein